MDAQSTESDLQTDREGWLGWLANERASGVAEVVASCMVFLLGESWLCFSCCLFGSFAVHRTKGLRRFRDAGFRFVTSGSRALATCAAAASMRSAPDASLHVVSALPFEPVPLAFATRPARRVFCLVMCPRGVRNRRDAAVSWFSWRSPVVG